MPIYRGKWRGRIALFHKFFVTAQIDSTFLAKPDGKRNSGGVNVHNIEHAPVYRAGFALYITLDVIGNLSTMPSLDSITFDSVPYTLKGDEAGTRIWHSVQGDSIGLFFFPIRPDIDASLDSIEALRDFYRRSAESGGLGVLEIERIEVDGCKAVRTIFKAKQQPAGRTYIGSITFPFSRFSFVLKIQCIEREPTGMRDSMVSMQLLKSGDVTIDPNGGMKGWLSDPYDLSLTGSMTRNRAEGPEHDVFFPDHPLSRARKLLGQVQSTVRLSDEIRLEAQP